LCHALLGDASLHHRLLSIDQDLAREAREGGCRACGGRLHRADYPRKPRGAPDGLGADFDRRLSFCCGSEGCRRRLTPGSVRFLDRRVWLSVVVTLACVATQGVSARRARRLREELGVDRRTLERWRRWWREELPSTSGWRVLRGKLRGAVRVEELPRSLFERFAGSVREKLLGLVRMLSPSSQSELMSRRSSMAR
jgi:hypothetical protein